MKTNYVLVDYENVQPPSFDVLNHEQVRVILFVGANQTKISLAVATALQQMGARAEYVHISGTGSNALDFHIAFTIGQLAAREPDAYFHIISKDAGFDPLISHLKQKKIRACRSCSVADIPLVKAAQASSTPERIALIIADLEKRGTARPRTVQTLTNSIATLFQKTLTDIEIAALLARLEKQGVILVKDKKVDYVNAIAKLPVAQINN